ncbi:MAG: HEPN domain-containing protein [Actinobacteria bacterium]|nr:HEPN domain-containing protein [Actinomycetota bacterium]
MENSKGIYKRWLYFAEEDLKFAKSGFRDKFYSHVCFLSQQIIEKNCKAFWCITRLITRRRIK